MGHIEGIENITEKELSEFKTKSIAEIVDDWRSQTIDK
jgi:hypothetical protein